jgi:hypothetical protein
MSHYPWTKNGGQVKQVIFMVCAGEPDIVGGFSLGMVLACDDLPKIHPGPSLRGFSFNRFEIRIALAQMAETANKLLKTFRVMERPAIDSDGERE